MIDGGCERRPRFDPNTAMNRLETVRISQASAEQRRGRAGRTAPGVCYRLWTEATERSLLPQTPPEILETDLAPLALELAEWGCAGPQDLRWLDPPPAAAYAQARELLHELEALDGQGRLTVAGRSMSGLGVHPRLAHMILRGARLGHLTLAVRIAALLSERDILRGVAVRSRSGSARPPRRTQRHGTAHGRVRCAGRAARPSGDRTDHEARARRAVPPTTRRPRRSPKTRRRGCCSRSHTPTASGGCGTAASASTC